ncbi:MAG: SBBP repeat-containing protein, partial [Flavobacteriales bacterium]|nr:SBBP repeat-containing protein [Flavobacteriales bacterium]
IITLWFLCIAHNFFAFNFEEHQGQFAAQNGEVRNDILFRTKIGGTNILFHKDGVSFYFYKIEEIPFDELSPEQKAEVQQGNSATQKRVSYAKIFKKFIGANPNAEVLGQELTNEKKNYFLGHLSEGIKNVPLYKRLTYHEIYPNIDLVFYEKAGRLKYDFILRPGANVEDIKMLYESSQSSNISKDGVLSVDFETIADFYETKPLAYDEQGKEVDVKFTPSEDGIGFLLGKYDKSETIIIDPELYWSTNFIGNSSNETWTNPVFDRCNNMYGVAYTYDEFMPVLNSGGNWFQQTFAVQGNITELIIVKFAPNGELLWSTYYGGDAGDYMNVDYGKCMAIDGNDQIYIAGRSGSNNLFLKDPGNGAYFENNVITGGTGQAFILQFNPAGDLIWATRFNNDVGSTSNNGTRINGIVGDDNGNLYFTGSTYNHSNVDIPVRDPGGGAFYQPTFNGDQNSIVGKFDVNHSLVWSTYINEPYTEYDQGSDITVDNNGNVFMTGRTTIYNQALPNPSFKIVNPGGGAYIQNQHGDVLFGGIGGDSYIMKFDQNLSLVWSTLYGGDDQDIPSQIEADANGRVHIVGRACKSTDFPTLDPGGGAYFEGARTSTTNHDSYLISFDNNGVRQWATYFGTGVDGNTMFGLGASSKSSIYVSGYVWNGGLNTQNNPGSYFQPAYGGGGTDGVLLKLGNNYQLEWATYLGGNANESYYIKSTVHETACGDTIFATFGRTQSTNFPYINPGTPAWFQDTMGGASGASTVTKFLETNTQLDTSKFIDTVVCTSPTVLLDAYQAGKDATYLWQDGSTDSVYWASTSDTFWVDITINCCVVRDTFIVTILEPPANDDTLVCSTQNLILDATTPGGTYVWQDASVNATYNPVNPGIYWVDITVGGCTKRDTFEVEHYKDSVYQIAACAGTPAVLNPTYNSASA